MPLSEIVVVGAGEAGARATIALREQGYDGALTLVGEEPHAPYERPPLSKAAIVSEAPPQLPVIADARQLTDLGVDVVAGVAATRIGARARTLHLADGRALRYDKLVLATGARPRRLGLLGAERALMLRTFEDSAVLRQRFQRGARIAIIGGGFIGLELAASARALGCAVQVVEAAPRVLQRATPPEISTIIAERHQREGVEIFTGVGVASFSRGGASEIVTLADGRRLEADTIVVGVGAAPETSLAAEAGLAVDNGVAVDGRLRTSDPDIFAVGDCANFPHPLFGGRRMRLEAWRNAFDQGAFVARALLGAEAEYEAVPWFWSDQYDFCLQIAGLPDAGVETVTRDLGGGALLLFHLAADGRLVGVSGIGPLGKIAKEVRVGEMLIARRARPEAAALAAPEVKLKGLL
jgi:3-phenylpropionate/trans-cinnamate dioxygenase ferredoxin reductase component